MGTCYTAVVESQRADGRWFCEAVFFIGKSYSIAIALSDACTDRGERPHNRLEGAAGRPFSEATSVIVRQVEHDEGYRGAASPAELLARYERNRKAYAEEFPDKDDEVETYAGRAFLAWLREHVTHDYSAKLGDEYTDPKTGEVRRWPGSAATEFRVLMFSDQ
jgi:hypothetical protein